MTALASWIRERDEPHFARTFAPYPHVHLWNGRTESVPWAEVQGLLLTGGSDISIDFLKQPVPDERLVRNPDRARDEWEFDAVARALERRLPILAICRGMQVLNVVLGGTLLLDIPGHADPAAKTANVQLLRFAPNAFPQFPLVNSSHHQAIDRLGAGLVAHAWHIPDGIIEQVRLSNYPFALGVQYHPERDPIYQPLFQAFLNAIETRQASSYFSGQGESSTLA